MNPFFHQPFFYKIELRFLFQPLQISAVEKDKNRCNHTEKTQIKSRNFVDGSTCVNAKQGQNIVNDVQMKSKFSPLHHRNNPYKTGGINHQIEQLIHVKIGICIHH